MGNVKSGIQAKVMNGYFWTTTNDQGVSGPNILLLGKKNAYHSNRCAIVMPNDGTFSYQADVPESSSAEGQTASEQQATGMMPIILKRSEYAGKTFKIEFDERGYQTGIAFKSCDANGTNYSSSSVYDSGWLSTFPATKVLSESLWQGKEYLHYCSVIRLSTNYNIDSSETFPSLKITIE